MLWSSSEVKVLQLDIEYFLESLDAVVGMLGEDRFAEGSAS